jgi:integrative and conjugative element protein (TIGR02256 family)
MPINSELLEYYNHFFENHPDFKLTETFVEKKNPEVYSGVVMAINAKRELILNVNIPFNYPYNDLLIYTKSIKGYNHLIYKNEEIGSWFCLNTPFVESIEERLNLEIDKLSDWITIYLNGEFVDDHYDYLIFPKTEPYQLLFSEEPDDLTEDRFSVASFGTFDLYKFKLNNQATMPVFFADQLGNKQSQWNTSILSPGNKDDQKAYWVYVENEPVTHDKTVYSSWSDLCEHSFQETFVSYIKHQIKIEYVEWKKKYTDKKFGRKTNYSVKKLEFSFPLAIGYKIPSEKAGYEIHWELILLYYHEARPLEKIGWANSKNISEQRFFGRGAFCEELRKLSILIIGVGAIGSSIAEILVRGGTRSLTLADGDSVDAGNICRSTYSLYDYNSNKALRLVNNLQKISPFAKLNLYNVNFSGQPHFTEEYEKRKEEINKYDLIIDCSASNEVLYFLSNLETNAQIITLGITDKANQLLCLSKEGGDSLFDKRRVALYSFGEVVPPSFYEGTGCFYPTFEASFFDINALVNMALRHINKQFLQTQKIKSFHVSYNENKIEICDYQILYQKELNFTLTIFQSCVDIIHSLSLMNFPYEFGGVLVGGYSDNGKHIYITDVLLPDSFTNSSVSFKGDTKRINKELLKLHEKTNGNIVYLGDWHSHPNMSNHYSSVDFRSIEQQAQSTTVSINNPVLAINSIRKNGSEIGYYIYFEGNLYKFSENQ